VELRLSDLHSPEQITGSMRKEGYDAPSHETIYRYTPRHHKILSGAFTRT
jgi:hypothetical protein